MTRGGARLEDVEALYRDRYRAFLRVATAVAGDESAAADAVHDAFVRAVRHRNRFRGEGTLEGWVWRMVVNEARRRCAREPRRAPRDSVAPPPAHDPAATRNGDDGTIRALLAVLPERQRSVLFLRYYADLDYNQIAEALDIAPGTVAATLHAAHTALRKQLEGVPR